MEKRDAKQIHRIFISEVATTLICIYIIYLLSKTLESGLDIRLIIPGIILIFVLLQGCVYWYLRDRKIKGLPFNTTVFLKTYRILKKITPYVISVYPLFLVVLLIFNRGMLF
ncbi:MAG: hypothetical protein RR790_09010, partial [Eubacterium sp.]